MTIWQRVLAAASSAAALVLMLGAASTPAQAQAPGFDLSGNSPTFYFSPIGGTKFSSDSLETGDVVFLLNGSSESKSNWAGLLDFSTISGGSGSLITLTNAAETNDFASTTLPANYFYEDVSTSQASTLYAPGSAQYFVNLGTLNGSAPTPEASTIVPSAIGAGILMMVLSRKKLRARA